jgi:two-component system response regulator
MPSADVLIVNDRMMDAQTTLVAFEQVAPRARVLHLMNGSDALQYLFSTGIFAGRALVMPQLMVLSLEMKGIGGLCILDLVRAHPLTREIPVVLVGLEENPRIYRRHDQFDASAYLMMPWDFGRYCAIIEGCTSRWLPWALRPAGVPHGGRFKTSTMLKPARAPKFDTQLTLPSLNLAT